LALVGATALTMIPAAVGNDCFPVGVRPYRVIEIDPIGQPINLDLALGVGQSAQPTRRLSFGMNRHLEAVFFAEDTTASPLDLAAVCGNDAIGRADDVVTVMVCDESEELVIAVGGDALAGSGARVWGRLGGPSEDWCCALVADRIIPTASTNTSGEYELDYAHAVAPSGHMIAHGRAVGTSETLAIFVTCAADLNGDGRVDGADLGALLAAWGSCPTSGPCPENLNPDIDDVVDGADLGILLNAWSGPAAPCIVWPIDPVCPQSLEGNGVTPVESFAAAISALGFGSGDALAAWYAEASASEQWAIVETIAIVMNSNLFEEE